MFQKPQCDQVNFGLPGLQRLQSKSQFMLFLKINPFHPA